MITRQDVAVRLTDYLHHRLSLEDLVNWAEDAMMEGGLDDRDIEVIWSRIPITLEFAERVAEVLSELDDDKIRPNEKTDITCKAFVRGTAESGSMRS